MKKRKSGSRIRAIASGAKRRLSKQRTRQLVKKKKRKISSTGRRFKSASRGKATGISRKVRRGKKRITRSRLIRRRYPLRREMSPVFRKYTRKVQARKGLTYAIADVGFVSPPNSYAVRRTAIKMGYYNARTIREVTFRDVEEALHSLHGDQQSLIRVYGFVHLKPRSKRRGVGFGKSPKSANGARGRSKASKRKSKR